MHQLYFYIMALRSQIYILYLSVLFHCRNGSVIVIFIIVIEQRIPVQTANQPAPAVVSVSIVTAVLTTGLSNNVNNVIAGSTSVGGKYICQH